MEFKNERQSFIYKYDVLGSDEEIRDITKIALERFAQDTEAQIEYGIVSMLKDLIKLKEQGNILLLDSIKKQKRRAKNGSKNNDIK